MRRTTKAALTLAATVSTVGGDGGGGRRPRVGEALPAAEHSPAVLGSGQRRHAGGRRLRAALRADHRAEQLLRDHRGEQGWRRWPHSHLRADRGQPAARPDHARPVRVWHRHHRKPDPDRNLQLHRQGDRREPDLHAGLPDHHHRAGPAGPAAVQFRRGLPGERSLRAARRHHRAALRRAAGHQPQRRRDAQHRSPGPCPRACPCPPPSPDPARRSAVRQPHRASSPHPASP